MLNIEKLFKFPILMIDTEGEERRKRLSSSYEDSDPEIIYGEAEYPYYDFVGIEDRWIPKSDSLENAKIGEFDACVVKFNNVAPMLVAWSKDKFKKEYIKFVEKIKEKELAEEGDYKVSYIAPDKLAKLFAGLAEEEKEKEDDKDPE